MDRVLEANRCRFVYEIYGNCCVFSAVGGTKTSINAVDEIIERIIAEELVAERSKPEHFFDLYKRRGAFEFDHVSSIDHHRIDSWQAEPCPEAVRLAFAPELNQVVNEMSFAEYHALLEDRQLRSPRYQRGLKAIQALEANLPVS